MSFASMHNDYLDPDTYLYNDIAGEKELFEALKQKSATQYLRDYHCDLNGEDSDLDRCGHKTLKLIDLNLDVITFTARAYVTIVGGDVTLNLPKNISAEESSACHEIYLEQAGLAVEGFIANIYGEWDGEDWCLWYKKKCSITAILNDDETINADKTSDLIIKTAYESLAEWDTEIGLLQDFTNTLAGWTDLENNECEEGKPGAGSVWQIYQESKSS